MSTEYAGNDSYPATITVPTDDDEFDVASVDVPLEQLADRTHYLKQLVEDGIGFELTDAVLHGDTTFPDGSIDATVTDITLVASNGVSIAAVGAEAFLGGNNVSIGSTTTVAVTATTDMTVTVGDDLTLTIGGDVIITADTVDLLGGVVLIAPTAIELATNVTLGGGTGDNVDAQGTLRALHNATFAAGKTVGLLGTTTAADLRATVSNAAGITYSGAGRAHYRDRHMVDADFSGGPFMMHPSIADVFYVTSLSGTSAAKIDTGGTTVDEIIEVSTLGMTGGFNLEIYASDEVTLLLTMTATGNSWSRWKAIGGGAWRLLGVSDG